MPSPSAAKLIYLTALMRFGAKAQRLVGAAANDGSLEAAQNELLASARGLGRSAGGMYSRVALAAKREVAEMLGRSIPAEPVGEFKAVFSARQIALVQRAVMDQVSAIRLDSNKADLKALRHRLRLIADNEAHKLFEHEVERWAQAAGADGGWYVTARDERVRRNHRRHEGRFYSFSERPQEMGEINCRCRLVPRLG